MVKFDPSVNHRRSIRLPGYNYSQPGAYFVTICAYNHQLIFGKIFDGEMIMNRFGEIVLEELIKTDKIRKEIRNEFFTVMPNHIHCIVFIDEIYPRPRRGDRPVAPTTYRPIGPKNRSIGSFVAGFKSAVTTRINTIRNTPGMPVWQRNYYEHIIRDDEDYLRIAEYILDNPLKWESDEYHA